MTKRTRNSKRPSRSILIHSRATISMLVPVSSRAGWSRRPGCSSVALKSTRTTIQSPALSIQIYRSLGCTAEMQAAARKAVERAESGLARQPENPRPAYLGAAALITLGDKDRAREWLARALATDPDEDRKSTRLNS